jgi:hypothetical protein
MLDNKELITEPTNWSEGSDHNKGQDNPSGKSTLRQWIIIKLVGDIIPTTPNRGTRIPYGWW